MFITCALRGLWRAATMPRLALVLWLVNLVLAAVAALPALVRWSSAVADRPEGDRLLQGLSLGLLAEMAHYDGPALTPLVPVLAGVVGVTLLLNAFMSGGALEVLHADDDRRLLHRFGRGGGHFFGRFLRAGLLAAVVAALVGGILAAAVTAVGKRLEDSPWEPMAFTIGVIRLVLVGGTLVTVLMALDLARVQIVRDDARRVVRIFFRSLGLALRHPVRVLGLWGINGLAILALLVAYGAYRNAVPAATWPLIALMALVQQAVMVSRAGLRVALLAGEMALVARIAPPAPVEATPATPALEEEPKAVEPPPPEQAATEAATAEPAEPTSKSD